MTFDELEKKTIEVKKRGLNILVENELISDIRKEYYEKKYDQMIIRITETFQSNVQFLNRIHNGDCTAGQVREFMGIAPPQEFNKVLYKDYRVFSFKIPFLVASYFGLPMDLLLFQDLQAHEEQIRKQYPHLFKQSNS